MVRTSSDHDRKNDPDVLKMIREASKWDPFNPEIFYWLGVKEYYAQNYKASIVSLEKALELNPMMNKAQKYLDFVRSKQEK